MEYPGERPGEVIYVSKKAFDGIHRKAVVRHIRVVRDPWLDKQKLVIEFQAKKGGGKGVLELYDLGPKL